MSSNEVRALLVAARETISDPARHTTDWYALSARKHVVTPNHKSARRWCAQGAVLKELNQTQVNQPNGVVHPAFRALYDAAIDLYGMPAQYANDKHGHPAAMAIFDRAIAALDEGSTP